jgi:hypothetical protein
MSYSDIIRLLLIPSNLTEEEAAPVWVNRVQAAVNALALKYHQLYGPADAVFILGGNSIQCFNKVRYAEYVNPEGVSGTEQRGSKKSRMGGKGVEGNQNGGNKSRGNKNESRNFKGEGSSGGSVGKTHEVFPGVNHNVNGVNQNQHNDRNDQANSSTSPGARTDAIIASHVNNNLQRQASSTSNANETRTSSANQTDNILSVRKNLTFANADSNYNTANDLANGISPVSPAAAPAPAPAGVPAGVTMPAEGMSDGQLLSNGSPSSIGSADQQMALQQQLQNQRSLLLRSSTAPAKSNSSHSTSTLNISIPQNSSSMTLGGNSSMTLGGNSNISATHNSSFGQNGETPRSFNANFQQFDNGKDSDESDDGKDSDEEYIHRVPVYSFSDDAAQQNITMRGLVQSTRFKVKQVYSSGTDPLERGWTRGGEIYHWIPREKKQGVEKR